MQTITEVDGKTCKISKHSTYNQAKELYVQEFDDVEQFAEELRKK